MQNEKESLSLSLGQEFKTPRAAAAAGIVFSLLLAATMVLLRLSGLPAMRGLPEQTWNAPDVSLALHLVPFAGISFIWFMGVLRDRLGKAEDRFFATVFWSSGILFLATFFVSAAVAGATTGVFALQPWPARYGSVSNGQRNKRAPFKYFFTENGSSIHNIHSQPGPAHQDYAALDSPDRLPVCVAASHKLELCRLAAAGLSLLDFYCERVHIGGQL